MYFIINTSYKLNMKKFLIILLIIGVLFTAIGFVIIRCNNSDVDTDIDNVCNSSFSFNIGSFFNNLFSFTNNKDNYINKGSNFFSSKQIQCKYKKIEKYYDDLSKIDINVNAYNVYILDDSKNNKLFLEINMPIIDNNADKHLFDIVLDKNDNYIKIDRNTRYKSLNGYDYSKYQDAKKNAYIKIHFPKNYYLKNIIPIVEIKNSMCNINIDALNANNLDINASMGNIEVYNIISNNLVKIKAKMGDIESKNIKSKKLEVTNSMGDINLEDVDVSDSVLLDTRMGNIESKNIKSKKLEVTNSMGDINLEDIEVNDNIVLDTSKGDVVFKNIESEKLEATNSMGDITLKDINVNDNIVLNTRHGDINTNNMIGKKHIGIDVSMGSINANSIDSNDLKVDCSQGSVCITLKDYENNYNYDLDASMSDLKINDNEFKRTAKIRNKANKFVKVDNSMGKITIVTK